MTTASIIFWLIFIVPLVLFLTWVMSQDKRKGRRNGLIVLAIIVVVGIVYMYWKTKGN